jgi:macrolide transport system ATP-binding/permease protein
MSWRRMFAKLFRRHAVDDLEEEIRAHLQMEEQENRESGMPPKEAYYAARRRFGNVTMTWERSREMWGWNFVEELSQDLRYGLRQLRHSLGFTIASVFALAMGIGVNTAVFTAYKTMIARPLDARDPGEMVNLGLTRDSAAVVSFSYPDYEAYRESVLSFRDVIAFSAEQMSLTDAGGVISQRNALASSGLGRLGLLPFGASNAEFARVNVVSENYFTALGVGASRGRTFDSALPSVLITENYWQSRFASDPAALGKMVRLNGAPVTIVGITPRDFTGTDIAVPDFWLPFSADPLVHADEGRLTNRENPCCRLFARLAPGVNIRQAQAEMTLVAERIRALHDPHSDAAKPATALVWPGSPFPRPLSMMGGLQLTIVLVMLAAAMLLVVACANAGSLQMARARSRQNELRTRLSLGATRPRLLRQLLTESALLGLIAGAVALLFSWALLQIGVTLAGEALPPSEGALVFNVAPDLEIFAYVLIVSLVAGILFGLAPAIESSRPAAEGRASTSSVRGRRLQDFLIAAQVSLSLVLTIAGSMLIHSAIHTLTADPGYDSAHVVDLELRFPEGSKYSAERRLAVVRDLRTRLAALPGVSAITSGRPPEFTGFPTAGVSAARQSTLYYAYVQANYFETLRIPILLGRGFQPGRSAVLSESAAKQLWPGENPVGRSIRLGPTDDRAHTASELSAEGPAYLVIGVARDTSGAQFDGGDARRIYLPLPEDQFQKYPILLRTQSDPAQVMKAIDVAVSATDSNLIATSSTLDELLRVSPLFAGSSIAAAIASTLGLLGLLLASLGIHGTVSYIVVLRTREVGIRMAIGAKKRDILGLILGESTRPVLVGLLTGMLLSVGASYLLRGLLYGLHTVDGISFAGVSLLFLSVALLAAYPPARRAMRVDPVVALRYE